MWLNTIMDSEIPAILRRRGRQIAGTPKTLGHRVPAAGRHHSSHCRTGSLTSGRGPSQPFLPRGPSPYRPPALPMVPEGTPPGPCNRFWALWSRIGLPPTRIPPVTPTTNTTRLATRRFQAVDVFRFTRRDVPDRFFVFSRNLNHAF